MHNRKTTIEDLLIDQYFIQWVRQPTEEHHLYWNSWIKAHPERKSDVLLAKEIITRSEFHHKEPSQEAYDEVLQRLMKTNTGRNPLNHRYTTSPAYHWNYRLKVAASILLCALVPALIMWWVYQPSAYQTLVVAPETVTKNNPAGIKSQLQLPDGTIVWLNAASSLTYPVAFDSLSRQVMLEGEAFFDVAEDKLRPFTVQSGKISTTALGTSFNISSYPREETIEISLVTGQVLIGKNEVGGHEQVVIDPGEQIIYQQHTSGFIKSNFDYDASMGWKDGLLVFQEVNITQIKTKLERWYGVSIEIQGTPAQAWKISGTFRNQSLERVLERLAFSKGFTYEISGKQAVLNFTQDKNS